MIPDLIPRHPLSLSQDIQLKPSAVEVVSLIPQFKRSLLDRVFWTHITWDAIYIPETNATIISLWMNFSMITKSVPKVHLGTDGYVVWHTPWCETYWWYQGLSMEYESCSVQTYPQWTAQHFRGERQAVISTEGEVESGRLIVLDPYSEVAHSGE